MVDCKTPSTANLAISQSIKDSDCARSQCVFSSLHVVIKNDLYAQAQKLCRSEHMKCMIEFRVAESMIYMSSIKNRDEDLNK